jgi:two-component sensor histidine kinase
VNATREFPAVTTSVPEARRFALTTFADLPAHVLDTVALVVSELVTNALLHAKTVFELRLEHHEALQRIRIEVADLGSGQPEVLHPPPSQPRGRGLQIVRFLSHSWGVHWAPEAHRKTVWAEILVDMETSGTVQPQVLPEAR